MLAHNGNTTDGGHSFALLDHPTSKGNQQWISLCTRNIVLVPSIMLSSDIFRANFLMVLRLLSKDMRYLHIKVQQSSEPRLKSFKIFDIKI
jgi:hypothetical protein